MKHLFIIVLVFNTIKLHAQKRLELLETNISIEKIVQYSDSYLWTKNWWLTNGIIVDTTKGGNAISKQSKLSKNSIESLGKEFRKLISPDVVRFGNLIPRINFFNSPKQTPYIKASIYEISESSIKLIAQFLVEFGSGQHNNMKDILTIIVIDPKTSIPISFESANKLYKRKPNKIELDMTPPQISGK